MPPVFRLILPLLVALAAAALAVSDRPSDTGSPYSPGTRRVGRVILVMVDSLTDRLAEDPASFPSLAKLRPRALWGRMQGCLPASTVTCTRTLLEGSGAGYVAGLSNFSASRANSASWPVVAVREGLRIAVASDHTLVNMTEGLGGPRLHYSAEKVPVFGWDEAAAQKAKEWMRADVADAYLFHLVDLDKASHVARPGTELYLREVAGADRAIAAIVELLTPVDSLIVVGDHGHDAFGNHTPDPGYLALGPAFAPGRLDISQATTALLLSAATGTPLPDTYAGEVLDSGLGSPFGGSVEAQHRIAAEVRARVEARSMATRSGAWRFLWGLAFALGVLVALVVERGRRATALAIVLVAGVGAWVLGSVWATHARPLLWHGPTRNIAHHAGLVVGFVVAANLVLSKLTSLGRAARVGVSLLAFPLLVPLVGEDYFASPTSLARFFVPALALLVHAELARRSPAAIATLGSAVLAVVLMLGPIPDGEGWVPASIAAILGAVVIAWCSNPSERVRAAFSAAVVLFVLGAAMDLGARSTLALALLAATTSWFVRSNARHVSGTVSLVGAGAVFLAYWTSLHTLKFEKVRFDFIFDLFPNWSEAALAVVGTLATTAKYALLPWVIVSAAPKLASVEHGPRLVGWLLLSALLHAAWVAGAVLQPGSRYDEFGIQVACLVAALALVTVGVLALRRPAPS